MQSAAPCKLAYLADVAKGGSHYNCGVVVSLEVLVDAPHAEHARVLVRLKAAALLLLMPILQVPCACLVIAT